MRIEIYAPKTMTNQVAVRDVDTGAWWLVASSPDGWDERRPWAPSPAQERIVLREMITPWGDSVVLSEGEPRPAGWTQQHRAHLLEDPSIRGPRYGIPLEVETPGWDEWLAEIRAARAREREAQ